MTANPITIRDYKTEIIGNLDDAKKTWFFPTIRGVNNLGKPIEWTIFVRAIRLPYVDFPAIDIKEEMFLDLESLLENKPLPDDVYGFYEVKATINGGKTRISVPTFVKKGKNLKSKNATNTFCQALRDALGKYNKQLQKGVGAPVSDTVNVKLYPPMLAQIYSEQKKKEFPVSVQRKYNGIRACVTLDTDQTPIIYSRKLKLYYGFNKIRDDAKALITSLAFNRLYLDGELYKHGMELQLISGMTRRADENNIAEDDVMFYIYDCFTPDNNLTYLERQSILQTLFKDKNYSNCILADTFVADTEDDVMRLYKEFLAEGYEGAMVRQNKLYDFSYNDRHSKFLLKLKEKFDAEYRIIDWMTGTKGKAAKSLMIVCETDTGEKFNVTPAMPIEEREILAAQMSVVEDNGKTFFENNYKDKLVIIEYDEKSIKGVPQRARTKMVLRTWD
jgi:ATP-dependent DNA ligase